MSTLLPAQVVLTGSGSATIDGIIDPTEWAHAGTTTLTGINEPGTSTTTSGTVYAMNDSTNLYLAVRVNSWHTDPAVGGSVAFAFINSGTGTTFSTGDNNLVLNSFTGLSDNYYAAPYAGLSDTSDGGVSNGAGAFTTDATTSSYELSFPLNSGDALHDFSLVTGQSVLFQTTVQLITFTTPGDYNTWASAMTITPDFIRYTVSSASAVPEPSAWSILAGGIGLGFVCFRRFRAKR